MCLLIHSTNQSKELVNQSCCSESMINWMIVCCRLLEIVSYKIQSIVYEEIRLDMLNTSPPRWFRVEEIPKDELELNDDELLIPVAHFSKEIYSGFGIPFLLKAKEGELFSQVKGRISCSSMPLECSNFDLVPFFRENSKALGSQRERVRKVQIRCGRHDAHSSFDGNSRLDPQLG